jgi:hypothetical protein
MNAVGFLLIAVVIAACGSILLYLSQRPSTSVEDGVESFRRGLDALGDARQPPTPRHRQVHPADSSGGPAAPNGDGTVSTRDEWSRRQES